MKILFVSAEVAPFAKVGGLADVAAALPKALRTLGHDARVIMPYYKMIENDPRWNIETRIEHFPVNLGFRGEKRAYYKETNLNGLPVGFVGTDEWFTSSVSNQSIYQPGDIQFLFFSRAVIKAMEHLEWIPDVIHCNDWHTGFVPVLIREQGHPIWDRTAAVYTIHNLAFQGESSLFALDVMGLTRWLFNPDQVEAHGHVNFLKSGCVFSDRVNTVSNTYAQEIQTPYFGHRLDGLMRHLNGIGRLRGILNGLDTEIYNPATDPNIEAHFSAKRLAGKAKCREKLLEHVGMDPMPNTPVFGVVSRLTSQKGMDLILHASKELFSLPIQLVMQGTGDPWLMDAFHALQGYYPNQFRYRSHFDDPVNYHIYSGADGFLMPSSFEPCGLSQMIAMRYGTVPVVRKTGGLADTVQEPTYGFDFVNQDPMDLLAAVSRARNAYLDKKAWKKIMLQGMNTDFSWTKSAGEYVKMYEDAIESRLAWV
ncbi:MAG: glycogen/starch synthase [Fimbriimonas sp.]|nr:glycogen/starch synthase [Fimbriimonas sp.]